MENFNIREKNQNETYSAYLEEIKKYVADQNMKVSDEIRRKDDEITELKAKVSSLEIENENIGKVQIENEKSEFLEEIRSGINAIFDKLNELENKVDNSVLIQEELKQSVLDLEAEVKIIQGTYNTPYNSTVNKNGGDINFSDEEIANMGGLVTDKEPEVEETQNNVIDSIIPQAEVEESQNSIEEVAAPEVPGGITEEAQSIDAVESPALDLSAAKATKGTLSYLHDRKEQENPYDVDYPKIKLEEMTNGFKEALEGSLQTVEQQFGRAR